MTIGREKVCCTDLSRGRLNFLFDLGKYLFADSDTCQVMMMELCKTKLEQEKQQRDVDEVLSYLASSC